MPARPRPLTMRLAAALSVEVSSGPVVVVVELVRLVLVPVGVLVGFNVGTVVGISTPAALQSPYAILMVSELSRSHQILILDF